MNIRINSSKLEMVRSHWGKLMPMMGVEELSELTQAISKMERYGNWPGIKKHVIEEMGDVLISIGALMDLYEIEDCDIESYISEKLNKNYSDDIKNWCDEHGVSVKARNCLLRARISLEAFALLSENELYEIRGAGKKMVEEFKHMQEMYISGE